MSWKLTSKELPPCGVTVQARHEKNFKSDGAIEIIMVTLLPSGQWLWRGSMRKFDKNEIIEWKHL